MYQTIRGFSIDRHRVELGRGKEIFEHAATAIGQWKMFPTSMAKIVASAGDVSQDDLAAVVFRAGVIWTVNPCRVVYLINDHGAVERRGFAYGTLPGHVAQGEERFCVEWNLSTDEVIYRIDVVSRPLMLARLGYPLFRFGQRRFRQLSGKALLNAIDECLMK
jgi:uncharacterized protein (UPF0548 family)